MKFNKNIIIIAIPLVLVFAFGFIKFFYFDSNSSMTTFMMELTEKNDKPFYKSDIKSNFLEFDLNFSYQVDSQTEFSIYLLHNFYPVPYSVNGMKETVHYVTANPSKTPLVSMKNRVYIENIDNMHNEFCFLVVGKNLIFVKRFQIDNQKGISNNINIDFLKTETYNNDNLNAKIFSSNIAPNNKLNINHDIINIVDEEFFLGFNLKSFFAKSTYFEEYSSLNTIEIPFILVPIIIDKNNKIIVQDLKYLLSKSDKFFVKLSSQSIPKNTNFRILLFPYPYSFNNTFLKSYKAELWSNILITNILKKDEV